MVEESLKKLNLTPIPELIKRHGSIRATTRNTGISHTTLMKHQHDYDCEHHIIVNGQIMFARETTPKLTHAAKPSAEQYKFIDNQLVRIS